MMEEARAYGDELRLGGEGDDENRRARQGRGTVHLEAVARLAHAHLHAIVDHRRAGWERSVVQEMVLAVDLLQVEENWLLVGEHEQEDMITKDD